MGYTLEELWKGYETHVLDKDFFENFWVLKFWIKRLRECKGRPTSWDIEIGDKLHEWGQMRIE